jgi:uncharacterized protein (TIGR00375 family)
MKFIGDFHIHSHFSIATSKELKPEFLEYWAKIKGIKIVGTGDFTHPGWTEELKKKLEPAEPGLFKVKNEFRKKIDFAAENDVRFVLTSEISNIYKKNGKVRKIHNVIFAPNFEVVDKIQQKLSGLGFNITSDGRPILGLDSKILLELCLDCSDEIFFVPAHIWTPWFSVLGSKSGFDNIEECFEDLSHHITAVEMGLSTDPPMNWMCSFLDKYTLTANSDAHSPEKLGRNANLFDTEISYFSIINAMKTGDSKQFLGTINFFPQEGKYHFDGHRKCSVCWNPLETIIHDEICPVCNKKITVGVMNRIAQLADRDNVLERKNRHPFYSLIPLKELLSEIEGVGPNSKKINQAYFNLIPRAGSELNLLMEMDVEDINNFGGEKLAESIRRMRNREVYIKEGFDGEFGKITVFRDGESKIFTTQELLFEDIKETYNNQPRPLVNFDLSAFRKLKSSKPEKSESQQQISVPDLFTQPDKIFENLNHEQHKAVEHFKGPALILAGPGTGKTRVLTTRIANLILNKGVNPENILAVTFTNKAAVEMKERLTDFFEDKSVIKKIHVSTFHAFGVSVLKQHFGKTGKKQNFSIINEEDKKQILQKIGIQKSEVNKFSENITEQKQSLQPSDKIEDEIFASVFRKYDDFLIKLNSFDFDDLVCETVKLFKEHPDILSGYQNKFNWLLIDEYQDVNFAQYEMVRTLMPNPGSNLFVIGDPNQAIYGFRGADVQFISRFEKDYPEATTYELKKSYRCTDSILRASGNVLAQKNKFLEGIQKGVKIKISENATEKSEAEFIARTIEQMIGGLGFFSLDSKVVEDDSYEDIESLSDFVILCRVSRQMKTIEKALNDHKIPYQKIGQDPFYSTEPVKSLIDLLKLSLNPDNSLLKERLLKNKIISEEEISSLPEKLFSKNLNEKIDILINKYFLKKNDRVNNSLKILKEMASGFINVEQFISHLSLGTGIDTWKPGIEAVNLMTLHASKGLEFNCVFIVGCEDGLLPYSYSNLTGFSQPVRLNNNIEEEQRLLYVGMTRAKKYLFLTHAKKRFLMGKEYQLPRSHFLDKIEKELIEAQKQEYKRKDKKKDDQLELF